MRELENRIKRAVVMAEGPKVTPEGLELTSAAAIRDGQKLQEAHELQEREFIRWTSAKHHGNITKAAAELGVRRPTLHGLLAKYLIERE